MQEPYSKCVGCKRTFYLTDKNSGPTIGSPEFETTCHRACCGKSEECMECSVYIQDKQFVKNQAMKNVLNILAIAVQALNDKQLHTLEKINVNIGPLVAAEIDKRDQKIRGYAIKIQQEEIVLSIKGLPS